MKQRIPKSVPFDGSFWLWQSNFPNRKKYLLLFKYKSDSTCNLCNSLIMGVTPSGAVTAVKKTGSGSFHSASVTEAMAAGAEVASEVHEALKEKLLQEERMGTGRKKHGFLKWKWNIGQPTDQNNLFLGTLKDETWWWSIEPSEHGLSKGFLEYVQCLVKATEQTPSRNSQSMMYSNSVSKSFDPAMIHHIKKSCVPIYISWSRNTLCSTYADIPPNPWKTPKTIHFYFVIFSY